ncbi:DegV family protein [Gordonia neofelifaecis]|uniref:DegV family protein n=1 Tax=Gordonia neofelifaecis NRRL B-59395 TaxID=644548 RepID=F1YDS1_9ACTN|nr:DegV family protein [Gordonia neofelifaecis]EGD57011.1 degV family protein [Gordonia neofelifaecis NRRL B-59395]
MSVAIVTDSSSRLPATLLDEHAILQVPLYLKTEDGVEYAEGVDDVPSDVISSMKVTTSGANLGDLKRAYAQAWEASEGDGVVAVHMSRRLSGTWSAARLAAEEMDGRVRVVDSRSVGISLGLTTMAAAQAAEAGGSRDAVYETAVRAAATAESMLCVQALDNLRRSGRISAASHLLGSALAIKPILHMSDGLLTLRERHRTSTKAIAKMLDAAVELAGDDAVTIGVQHCQNPELADAVLAQVTERVENVTSTIVVDLGAVLGIHVGPGAVGVTLGYGLAPLS